MDHDEIGGFCPQCDGEFQPGVTECPDCGIPLVGPDALVPAPPPGPRAPAVTAPTLLGIDAAWAPRLVVFALACAATVALELAGAVTAILSSPGRGGTEGQHDRIRSLVQIVTPGLAVVLLVGALAVVGARLLGDRRRWVQLTVFGAVAAVGGLAVVGAVTDVVWRSDNSGNSVAPGLLTRGAVLVVTGVAVSLLEPWVVDAEAEA